MLILQKLKIKKIKVVLLKLIIKNKNTIFNNIKIIKNIYTR